MKKLTAVALILAVMLALSACARPIPSSASGGGQTNTQSPDGLSGQNDTQQISVTRDRAIELALHTAGLTKEQVYDLSAELDRELLGTYWEVEFESGGVEYDYHIDAATEKIVKAEKHKD